MTLYHTKKKITQDDQNYKNDLLRLKQITVYIFTYWFLRQNIQRLLYFIELKARERVHVTP